ncbi:MAG: MFS transporter [Oscillospiraceae bacterium]|nr:MFS transporter [Oscillospiraceae bacterium]
MQENFSKRNIVLYLASQIISLFGSSLAQCVVFWYITLETGSATMMTVAMVAGFLPTFLVSPFAGVWADRYDRKRIIMLSDGIVALATLALVIAFRLGYGSVWVIIGAMAVRGLGQGVQQPAVGAFLPQLVPPKHLMRVNAINSSAQSAMMLVSPALGGLLISIFPIEITFAVDVVTAALAIFVLGFFVKSEKQVRSRDEEDGGKPAYLAELKLGFGYIAKHRFVGRIFLYMVPLVVLIAPVGILFSLIITQKFGADAWRLAVNDGLFAVGMICGSVLMMTWGGFKNRIKTVALGCAAMSVATIAYGIVPNFWIFLGFSVLVGVSMPLFNTPMTVILQENVDNEYLGRVMSISTMINTLGMPISLLIFGPLADVIGLSLEFIITGAAMLVITLIFALDRKMREADNKT